MTVKTKVQVTQEREIQLDEPKYIKLHDGIFWRFMPIEKENRIEVTMFSIDTYNQGFTFSVRPKPYDGDLDVMEMRMEGIGYKEITAEEFYDKLRSVIGPYNFAPLFTNVMV